MTYRPPPRRPLDYGSLIADAARMVWRHKFLWFFGLFAGTGTSLGGWNCNFPLDSDISGGNADLSGSAADWFHAHVALVFSLIAAFVVLLLLIWLWSLFCKGAVFASVRDRRQGRPIGFSAAMGLGRRHFGRLLLFNLFLLLIFLGAGAIIVAVIVLAMFMAASGGNIALAGDIMRVALELALAGLLFTSFGYLTCISFFIALPLFIAILFYLAERAVVLESLKPVAAIRRGMRLFLNNIAQALLLFLISIGLSIGGAIGAIFFTFIAAIPGGIAWIVAYNMDFSPVWIVAASILTLPMVVVAVTTIALINTYFSVYWTDAYLRLSETLDEPGGNAADTEAVPPP